jgi:hypothetical protein
MFCIPSSPSTHHLQPPWFPCHGLKHEVQEEKKKATNGLVQHRLTTSLANNEATTSLMTIALLSADGRHICEHQVVHPLPGSQDREATSSIASGWQPSASMLNLDNMLAEVDDGTGDMEDDKDEPSGTKKQSIASVCFSRPLYHKLLYSFFIGPSVT